MTKYSLYPSVSRSLPLATQAFQLFQLFAPEPKFSNSTNSFFPEGTLKYWLNSLHQPEVLSSAPTMAVVMVISS